LLNPKLEIPNSKQTQMSLPTGRQAKDKTQKCMILKIYGSIVEKPKLLFEFYILDLFGI
jgi:hypothetical protein